MCDETDAALTKRQRAARDPVTGKYMTVPGNVSYKKWCAKYVKGNAQAEAKEKAAQNKSPTTDSLSVIKRFWA